MMFFFLFLIKEAGSILKKLQAKLLNTNKRITFSTNILRLLCPVVCKDMVSSTIIIPGVYK